MHGDTPKLGSVPTDVCRTERIPEIRSGVCQRYEYKTFLLIATKKTSKRRGHKLFRRHADTLAASPGPACVTVKALHASRSPPLWPAATCDVRKAARAADRNRRHAPQRHGLLQNTTTKPTPRSPTHPRICDTSIAPGTSRGSGTSVENNDSGKPSADTACRRTLARLAKLAPRPLRLPNVVRARRIYRFDSVNLCRFCPARWCGYTESLPERVQAAFPDVVLKKPPPPPPPPTAAPHHGRLHEEVSGPGPGLAQVPSAPGVRALRTDSDGWGTARRCPSTSHRKP
ncbi:hypothetical protein MAPG_02087 [Magnaporthiopsis poae ATCC 64411]|uniref:Uncharacterized protein n=1 Tax=Magnaporthiopsis poae (strain ATCC 64411 / 73-15) TaxID=644358 RepID=A0A0C4DQE7_MAGP6|nr:hypothetical protein MAPG_02087 [Magnaporthiopsis poae ATCC 64411]